MVAPQSSVKRIRGVAVSRPIIVGTTATPLSPAEKLVSPPDHTHRWTVALRSAASHPIAEAPRPTVLNPGGGVGMEATGGAAGSSATVGAAAGIRPRNHFSTPSLSALNTTPGTPGHTGVSTRGRESELDFHRMVGGKDDISYFVRRVQFKLHETYAQPTRSTYLAFPFPSIRPRFFKPPFIISRVSSKTAFIIEKGAGWLTVNTNEFDVAFHDGVMVGPCGRCGQIAFPDHRDRLGGIRNPNQDLLRP